MTEMALVRQLVDPPASIPQMNRYTYELAWTQFRIGPVLGTPFATSQFPVPAFAQYANQLVPAWRNTATENPKNIAALVALVDEVCPCILLTWSQSGLFGWQTAVQRPNLVKAIVALEPAGINAAGVATGVSAADLAVLATIPILLEVGDFDAPRITSLNNFASSINILGGDASVLSLPALGIFGNGHLVFMEMNNLQVADVIIHQLEMMLGNQLK
jgi:pimeloyl-ACP methyl ester carboxylesterase